MTARKSKYFVIAVFGAMLSAVVFLMLRMDAGRGVPLPQPAPVVYTPEVVNPLDGIAAEELQQAAAGVRCRFRCGSGYLQHRTADGTGWKDFFMKGVNLGVALPGNFATQFAMTRTQYLEWFDLISRMNATTVRIYTILPPVFYEALAQFNLLHADRPLYLVQGVWARSPADGRYTHPESDHGFRQEIVRAVDVLNGRAHLPPRPGSASGMYGTDVSRYVAALILGHEWDPVCVAKTDAAGGPGDYNGHFVSVHDGTPMEVWLGRMVDYAVTYGTWKYGFQAPVSFINWQALDPMHHSSAYAAGAGADYDAVSLDFSHFHGHPGFRAGLFASYHVYPYFPDFVYRDPAYTGERNHTGQVDNFLAYVRTLVRRHPGMPLLVSEYGLSTSRGNSRDNPYGFHQGGHTEKEHAALVRILTEDIHRSGCAGALYFEWSDEWFKDNWITREYEQPRERRVFWHNAENPEQYYGILAVEAPWRWPDGLMDDWPEGGPRTDRPDLRAGHDAAYFYLALHLPSFSFASHRIVVAVDTYDPRGGNTRVPGVPDELPAGAEFLVIFDGPDSAALRVDADYRIRYGVSGTTDDIAPRPGGSGRWVRPRVLLHSEAEDVHGRRDDPVYYDRGVLQAGSGHGPENSLTDWCWNPDTRILEVRLPWQLLNISDPSSRAVVLHRAGCDTGYAHTGGIGIMAWQVGRSDGGAEAVHGRRVYRYVWEGWDEPEYRFRLKEAYGMFRGLYPSLVPVDSRRGKHTGVSFELSPFPEGCRGAVSVEFRGGEFSQYETAAPLMAEAGIRGTFRVPQVCLHGYPAVLYDGNGRETRRFGGEETAALRAAGHTVVPEDDRGTGPRPRYIVTDGDTVDTYQLEQVLARGQGTWTVIQYRHFDPETERSDGVASVPAAMFRRHLRLLRNSCMWTAPAGDVAAYQGMRQQARIKVQRVSGTEMNVTVSAPRAGDGILWLRARLPYRSIQVRGSAADGIYEVRDGQVLLRSRIGTTMRIKGFD